MDNSTHDFSTWFGVLHVNVLERTGVEFNDEDSVVTDYEEGRDVFAVIEDIVSEYGEQD